MNVEMVNEPTVGFQKERDDVVNNHRNSVKY